MNEKKRNSLKSEVKIPLFLRNREILSFSFLTF